MRDLPEWLQEFRHGLVDESDPEHRDASSSSGLREEFAGNLKDTDVPAPALISHDLDSECPTKVASGKHSIF